MAWKPEIRFLWKRVGEASLEKSGVGKKRHRYKGKKSFFVGAAGMAGPGNTSIKKLLSDSRYAGAVLDFLKSTRWGC